MRLLIVDDDRGTSQYLKKGLSEEGFRTWHAASAEEALNLERERGFDLIVLDVGLPGRDGWWLLKTLREDGRATPVLFLTARDAVADRVKGLGLGADDYLVKPFSFSELVARIRTVLRRGPAGAARKLQTGDLELDPVRRRAARGGVAMDLTPREFDLLWLLASRPGQVLTRAAIEDEIWDLRQGAGSNVVDAAVRRLRRKVEEPFNRPLIRTVRGSGYSLMGGA